MLQARTIAETPTGDVFIRNFDQAIVDWLEGELYGMQYFLDPSKVPGVVVPLYPDDHGVDSERGTPMPGIPFIFQNPGDNVTRYVLPCIRITAEDPSPALERWNGIHLKWEGATPGATPVNVDMGSGRVLSGHSGYTSQSGAYPYDIPYTITLESTGNAAKTHALTLLKYAMKKFPPNGSIRVVDDVGNDRYYTFFVEGPSTLSMVGDIAERAMIYGLSVRVTGELDLHDPVERANMVMVKPIIRTWHMETS